MLRRGRPERPSSTRPLPGSTKASTYQGGRPTRFDFRRRNRNRRAGLGADPSRRDPGAGLHGVHLRGTVVAESLGQGRSRPANNRGLTPFPRQCLLLPGVDHGGCYRVRPHIHRGPQHVENAVHREDQRHCARWQSNCVEDHDHHDHAGVGDAGGADTGE